jgi:SAM-dependent methyltransferase
MLGSLRTRLGFFVRRPWVSGFDIAGRRYGGRYDPSADPRVTHFRTHFPTARRVLELGSLEGAHSFALRRLSGVVEVVGVEGRASNIAKAEFVKRKLGISGVEFVCANLEDFDLSSLGAFDAIFCAGLLYHLPRPWELLRKLRRVSGNLVLATHYAPPGKADAERGGYRGMVYAEFGLKEPLSGLSPDSFWPTRDDLLRMLRDAGYPRAEVCHDDTAHPHGPLITLAAR